MDMKEEKLWEILPGTGQYNTKLLDSSKAKEMRVRSENCSLILRKATVPIISVSRQSRPGLGLLRATLRVTYFDPNSKN